MRIAGTIHRFPAYVRIFLLFFLAALSFGYATGFLFLQKTTHLKPAGIERNFNGNEAEEETEEYVFRKSEGEMLTIIHTHVISMSLIFLALGALLCTTSVHPVLRNILVAEPFVSIVLTFGGIWLLWKDVLWFRYVIMVSGTALNLSFALSVLLVAWQLLFPRRDISPE